MLQNRCRDCRECLRHYPAQHKLVSDLDLFMKFAFLDWMRGPPAGCGDLWVGYSPKNSIAVIELRDLMVLVVVVRLADGDKRVFFRRRRLIAYAVAAGQVPGVDARIVRRLDAAWSLAAALQQAITVRSGVKFSTVGALRRIAVTNPRVAQPQELVGQLELEAVLMLQRE